MKRKGDYTFSAVLGCCIICQCILLHNAFSADQITADPNFTGCSAEYSRTLQVKAGNTVSCGVLNIGGFIEARNEPRFNQGLLPNHNWRGFITGTCFYPVIQKMQVSCSLGAGVEHESSHATMGIVEPTERPYDCIYDHAYRKSVMNAVQACTRFEMFDTWNRLLLKGSLSFYFLSKNTPELPGLSTANSGGLTFNALYRHLFTAKMGCFVSLHERSVFQGSKKVRGEVYFYDKELNQKMVDYPIINDISAFSCCAGVSLPLFQSRHLCEIYLRYLYGHCYGYIDSREKRNVFSVGVALSGF
jgi:hypothetical protein